MDMINFSPFSKEKGGFDSISVKKQVEMGNEVSSDDNSRNDVDCFKKLVMACFQVRQINSGRIEVVNQSDISFKATVDGGNTFG